MALALEEMGFTRYGDNVSTLFKNPVEPVDVRTMKPPTSKKDFKPARYVMITGDPRISPNNDADVKAITSNNNIFDENDKEKDVSGQIIKVVLISQAGSEGLDFKGIRQVHILEPWYNINRIEQIIGRAVRNFSHKDLIFSKRNVQIFMYGTILPNTEEEAADLYVYRVSEIKAIKIGKITRLLKQTSVDCLINHDQTKLLSTNFQKIEENKHITQILSDHQEKKNFIIGDIDNTITCDFMECEFKCLPDINEENYVENTDTYNEKYMLINSDKIIQKIKTLMKIRYFYKKNDLIKLINIPKKYPISQIYAALTQLIDDNTEYITDKYNRTGYLINIGEYYLFQPSELNYKNISIYDRSVPINYKNKMIHFKINTNAIKPVIDKRGIDEATLENMKETQDIIDGKKVFEEMYNNYNITSETKSMKRGNDNWYELCGIVIRKMAKEDDIIPANTIEERLKILESFVIEHIVDSLMMDERINLLNYIYSDDEIEDKLTSEKHKRFFNKIKIYLLSKIITLKNLTGLIVFNGPSRISNLNVFVLKESKWVKGSPEDIKDIEKANIKTQKNILPLNDYVGFIGFENNIKYMVYQIKDTNNKRSTGFRCDQASKEKILTILNEIENETKYVSKVTKDSAKELCVRQELTLRSFERQHLYNKTWFLDTETAIMYEFQKREKP